MSELINPLDQHAERQVPIESPSFAAPEVIIVNKGHAKFLKGTVLECFSGILLKPEFQSEIGGIEEVLNKIQEALKGEYIYFGGAAKNQIHTWLLEVGRILRSNRVSEDTIRNLQQSLREVLQTKADSYRSAQKKIKY